MPQWSQDVSNPSWKHSHQPRASEELIYFVRQTDKVQRFSAACSDSSRPRPGVWVMNIGISFNWETDQTMECLLWLWLLPLRCCQLTSLGCLRWRREPGPETRSGEARTTTCLESDNDTTHYTLQTYLANVQTRAGIIWVINNITTPQDFI